MGMIQDTSKIKVIDRHRFDKVLERMKNRKYRCIFLLMYDGGLRPREACSLMVGDVNFRNQTMNVLSLKKRGKTIYRKVPMTARLTNELSIYYQGLRKKERGEHDYFFPARSERAKEEYA
jgi:integrase